MNAMIRVIHLLENLGFKSNFSSVHKEKKIFEKKENYSYARLVRKEKTYELNGIYSDVGLVLMSSLHDKQDGYSLFFVQDEDVLDFLLFENMMILKTKQTLYGFDWKKEKMVFKSPIKTGVSIDLVEPSMIIESSFITSLFLNPYDGTVMEQVKGRFVDAFYDNGRTAILSLVYQPKLKWDNINYDEIFLHFSFYKDTDKEVLYEYQMLFPYEELNDFMNTPDKLRSFYHEFEIDSLSQKISRLYDIERDNLKTFQNVSMIRKLREDLQSKRDALNSEYGENWFYHNNFKHIVRILGFSSEENVFYFSFGEVLFSINMHTEKCTTLAYSGKNVSLVKVIPSIFKLGIKTSEDLLVLRTSPFGENHHRYEGVEISLISNDKNKMSQLSEINKTCFIGEVDIRDARHHFLQYEDRLVVPKQTTKISKDYSRWSEHKYSFFSIEYLPYCVHQEKELFRFLGKHFSIIDIKNNRIIHFHSKHSSKEELTEENNIHVNDMIEKDDIGISTTKENILSFYDVDFIEESEKQMIRKLISQEEWFMPRCKPEREMISIILPDMIQKYTEKNEEIYMNAIKEILHLIKEVYQKKEKENYEKIHLDATFAVEYAKSLLK